jgi:hypothetical protein
MRINVILQLKLHIRINNQLPFAGDKEQNESDVKSEQKTNK